MPPPRSPVDPLTGLEAARFGVYVHFPFCLSKCPYCDFASIVAVKVPSVRYADAVLRELEQRLEARPDLEGREVHSIFIGGGTPSLWPPEQVARVLGALRQRFVVTEGAEVSLEANPGASDQARFRAFREAGVNRLSIGVQSFHPATLAFLGRQHDAQAAEAAFAQARAAGFDNVSLDFIYGVPGQTPELAGQDAARAASLGSEHLSAYALTLEKEALAEEVPLARQLRRGEVVLPSDEETLAMADAVRDVYAHADIWRYEVSNYARPGYHSRHNALYWTGGEYLALGTGATGYLRDADASAPDRPPRGLRYANVRSAEKYLEAVEAGALPQGEPERLTAQDLLAERVAMGLRMTSGVDVAQACLQHGESLGERAEVIERVVAGGLGRLEGGRLVLTPRGLDVHSAISARLL